MFGATPREKAFCAPFLVFLGLLALGQIVASLWEGYAFWAVAEPRYWINPLQTAVCGWLLWRGWRFYELRAPSAAGAGFAVAVGIAVLALWIAPQQFFGAAPRTDGFDPAFFGAAGAPWWANVTVRFLRLVIVVPLLEEIFWRGFLLRYLVKDDWERVPFGTFTWWSFAVVTVGFTLEHAQADWPAAALAGALYNLVAYRTRSLAACVLAHAVTNAALGWWVLRTGQWGFW